MTTTPAIWKTFTANIDLLPGVQSNPSVTHFADGSFLVTWNDDTKGVSPGTDIFAQRFDAEGNAQGSSFQLNTALTIDNEFGAQVATLPDGGLVIAYALDDTIMVERRDVSGRVVFTDALNDVVGNLGFDIAVGATGDYCIQFVQRFDTTLGPDFDRDAFGFVYEFETNARGERFATGRNASETDSADGVAAMADGGFAFASSQLVAGTDTTFVTAVDGEGQKLMQPTKLGDGFATGIAGLNNGNFVVTYERDGDVLFRLVNPEGGASNELVATQTGNVVSNSEVTQLKDGGFFIAWFDNNNTAVRGQRFDANGDTVGEAVLITSGLGPKLSPELDLSLTADGRINVSVEDGFSGIWNIILDPRDTTISGTGGDDVLTTTRTASIVFAGEGKDKILGQGGSDTIHGEGGNDILQGGGGVDNIDGGEGNDIVVLRDNHNSDVVDGGGGFDMLDLHNVANRAAVVDLGAGSWLMTPGFVEDAVIVIPDKTHPGSTIIPIVQRGITGIENVSGTQMGDRLTGTTGTQTLTGNGGDDTLSGAGGGDVLSGGIGNDTLDGGAGSDRLNGFDGEDTMRGGNGAGKDILLAGAGDDTLVGGQGADTLTGGLDSDRFVYDSILDGGDRITDFTSNSPEGDDIFLFDGGEFGGLNNGALNAIRFEANDTGVATQNATRFVFDTNDGVLTFDANGAASGGVTLIATLQSGAVLSFNDIAII